MPGLFAKKTEGVSATKLAMVWQTLDPVVQGYFEQLYEAVPDRVAEVLNGSPLPRDDAHPTLASWAKTVPEGEGGGLGDLSKLTVAVGELTIEPESPAPGTPFKVSWKGSVEVDFPPRLDRLDIYDNSGAVVTQRALEVGETKAGTFEGSAQFDGLPVGTYAVALTCNTQGAEGNTPNDHGFMSGNGQTLYVGETREAQMAQDAPRLEQVFWAVESLTRASEITDEAQQNLRTILLSLAEMDLVGGVLAETLRSKAGQLEDWRLEENEVPWTQLRDRLVGAKAQASLDSVAPFADTVLEVIDELRMVARP
ncbi:MAG TPA: hypothetical protein VFH58_05980 [Acidimicrobiales bacterium]|nr:hypothetical protein [Acidimicrobiales bacterium]